jgi:DNA replication factor GINS
MNLNELRSVQSRERQTDSLQQLRGSFYEEAGRFIQQLREEREQVAERADDPFDAPDVQRLTNEIKTAEQTVEAIYERRIGKLVKQASLEAAGMTADAEGLTTEEREAFDRIVSTIEENREHVLSVLANNRDANADTTTEDSDGVVPTNHNANPDSRTNPDTTPNSNPDSKTNSNSVRDETEQSASSSETTEPARTEETTPPERDGSTDPADSTDSINSSDSSDPTDSVEAQDTDDVSQNVSVADVMGDGGAAFAQESSPSAPPDVPLEAEPQNVSVHQSDAADTGNRNGDSGDSGSGGTTSNTGGDARAQVNRATVKITRDVGKILCVDEREYDLSEDDVVELPETNVGPLLEHDAAVRLG